MKTVYRWIFWLVGNSLFLAGLYFGYEQEIKEIINFVLFVTWLTIAFSPLIVLGTYIKYYKEYEGIDRTKKSFIIPAWIEVIYDILIIGILIWHGAIITGLFYCVHMSCIAIARVIERDYLNKNIKKEKHPSASI